MTFRKFITFIFILVVVIASALSVWAYSTLSVDDIGDHLADELASWSGYRVTFNSSPELSIFPNFQVSLKDVSFYANQGGNEPPSIQAKEMVVSLSLAAAVQGKISVSHTKLLAPAILVFGNNQQIPMPSFPKEGRIVDAIDAQRQSNAVNALKPKHIDIDGQGVGTIEFINGKIIKVEDGEAEQQELMTDVTGIFNWANLASESHLNAHAIWHGERLHFELSADYLLGLIAAGKGALAFELKSNPLDVQFDGEVAGIDPLYVSGNVSINATSLSRALEWVDAGFSNRSDIGKVVLSGKLVGTSKKINLSEAVIELDGTKGTGVLNLGYDEAIAQVTSTLDFQSLDLQNILTTFSHLPSDAYQASRPIDTRFIDQFSLDLRISARHALLGTLGLDDVAATVKIGDGFAAFDVSDAQALGGNVQLGMRLDRGENGNQGELRILASEIDGEALENSINESALLPRAKGRFSLILKGEAPSWRVFFAHAKGSFSAQFGPGYIPNFSLPQFINDVQNRADFPLAQVKNGQLNFDKTIIDATIIDGVVQVNNAQIVNSNYDVSLTGSVPLDERTLDLAGEIRDESAKTQKPVLKFIVAGAWATPFISTNHKIFE